MVQRNDTKRKKERMKERKKERKKVAMLSEGNKRVINIKMTRRLVVNDIARLSY